jgi:hypothetical protein
MLVFAFDGTRLHLVSRKATMKYLPRIGLGLLIVVFCTHVQALAQSSPKPSIEARLTLLTNPLHEGDQYEVKIEIENASDHDLLVGRQLTGINNWPFRIEIQLEDAGGHQYGPGGAAYLDGPPIADFSIKDGVLKWWMPLASHTFMGIHMTPRLSGIPPGKYKLHGRYVSFLPPSREKTSEENAATTKFSYFVGAVETNSIWIEVLPREKVGR